MIDNGVPKWLWLLPPGTAGKVLTKTGTGAADIAWSDAPTPQLPFAIMQVRYQDYIDLAYQTAGTTVTFNLNAVDYPSGDNHIPAEGASYNLIVQFYNEDSYMDTYISQLTKRMNNEIHIVTVFVQGTHYGIIDFQTNITTDPDTPFENSSLKVTKLA